MRAPLTTTTTTPMMMVIIMHNVNGFNADDGNDDTRGDGANVPVRERARSFESDSFDAHLFKWEFMRQPSIHIYVAACGRAAVKCLERLERRMRACVCNSFVRIGGTDTRLLQWFAVL